MRSILCSFQQVAFVLHGGDHHIIGQFARRPVGGRRVAQLLGHVVVTHDVPVNIGRPRHGPSWPPRRCAACGRNRSTRAGNGSVTRRHELRKAPVEGARGSIHLTSAPPPRRGEGIGRQHQSDRVRQRAQVSVSSLSRSRASCPADRAPDCRTRRASGLQS